MAPEQLVSAWENAYREYSDDAETDVADVSLEVATAWRALAENAELPWWLSAAVRSAAEAFERQGEACRAWAVNGVTIALPRQADGAETGGGAPVGACDQDVDDGGGGRSGRRATRRAGTRCTCALVPSQVAQRAMAASASRAASA